MPDRRAVGVYTCCAVFLDSSDIATDHLTYGARDADFDEWEGHTPYLEYGKRLNICHYVRADFRVARPARRRS